MDARMGEVYWGGYAIDDKGKIELGLEEEVIVPENITMPEEKQWIGCGNGWECYDLDRSALISLDDNHYPHAQDIARIAAQYAIEGRGVNAAEALPVYLRDNVAKKKGEQ
jgi:tRNA threonylcarbamoyladenosine biosynthesis protein TsaB